MKAETFAAWGLMLFVLLLVSGCATTQTVSYDRGHHVQNRVEPGSLSHIDHSLEFSGFDETTKVCVFHLLYTEYREKRVTPLYEKMKVTRTESYDPNPVELVFDIAMLPLHILFGGSKSNLLGHDVDIDKVSTDELVEGKTHIEGLLKMGPKPLQSSSITVFVNGDLIGRYTTNADGSVHVPAKPIANAYLKDKKVGILFRQYGGTSSLRYKFPTVVLENILNVAYQLGW